ncbi:TIGR02302 family protein [Lentibacter sp. XHP0401]|uniref:TIGR02302 family protein n=1 Tax=Lentibacter sp. XHP0401 TaxID=2984334 RepID=UPI002980FCF7|nr:TIGR02302 family protein [Lentibacter sp. XHP0401]
MPDPEKKPERIDLKDQVMLTFIGLWAERLCVGFWPLWSAVIATLAFFFLGLHDVLPLEIVWGFIVLAALSAGFGAWYAWRRFVAPSREEALERIDANLPGRPIRAVRDRQVIGAGDAASEALWREYQRRMIEKIRSARAIPPTIRLAGADPFGLRYVALLALAVALVFGSVWRLGTVAEIAAPGGGAAAAAMGPSWEGWAEPPLYTGLPSIYLNDTDADVLNLPEGSEVTLRLYGAAGALTVNETVSAQLNEVASVAAPEQSFVIVRDGELDISGAGGRSWDIVAVPDEAPRIDPIGPAETAAGGTFSMPFEAVDDYGIEGGEAVIALDMARLDRRYGLALEPESQTPITVPLPLPVTGARDDFDETLMENFSQHPWANLPVTINFEAEDEAGQTGRSGAVEISLVARKFFNPVAAAVVELRRDLLWNRKNGPRIAQLLRAISHQPDDLFKRETDYLRLRVILRRMEAKIAYGGLDDDTVSELAGAMWDLALNLEDGNLADALERMREAQDKLAEALRNGASDEEIAELMQELREATDDYMQQLAQQQQQEQDGEQGEQGESMQLSQQDLQDMMDRIQELMEQGRMAEAEQALREFQEMMENMRVTQNQSGQGEGQEAMEGLADTLREQQGLSDQAFRDLQEQFNPNARAGESGQNEGRNGGQGRGEQHEGQGEGEGRAEQGQNGSGEEEGQGEGGGGQEQQQSLAERQQALRDELSRQAQGLPQMGGEAGEAARDALDNAGRAMEQAEEALRQNDLAEAIDRQAEAMENLREGMDNLGEAMAQAREGQQGQDGQNAETAGRDSTDPLGRNRRGFSSTEESMVGNEDVYRRARELLDEIRRRTGEAGRSDTERSYLERLLDRF